MSTLKNPRDFLGSFVILCNPTSFLRSSAEEVMMFNILAISALAGLAFATSDNEWYPACKLVEAAISNASNVYYSGK